MRVHAKCLHWLAAGMLGMLSAAASPQGDAPPDAKASVVQWLAEDATLECDLVLYTRACDGTTQIVMAAGTMKVLEDGVVSFHLESGNLKAFWRFASVSYYKFGQKLAVRGDSGTWSTIDLEDCAPEILTGSAESGFQPVSTKLQDAIGEDLDEPSARAQRRATLVQRTACLVDPRRIAIREEIESASSIDKSGTQSVVTCELEPTRARSLIQESLDDAVIPIPADTRNDGTVKYVLDDEGSVTSVELVVLVTFLDDGGSFWNETTVKLSDFRTPQQADVPATIKELLGLSVTAK